MMSNVFVYGTLKPGEINYHICEQYVVSACPAIAPGQLYALPFGYPAMTPGTTWIHGFLLSLLPNSLPVLDDFEQHDPATFTHYAPHVSLSQNQYERQLIEVFDQKQSRLGKSWAYQMTAEQVRRLGGIWLPDGHWSYQQQVSVFSAHSQRWG